MMGCCKGNWGQRDWWSKDDILIGRRSPFRLNKYMIRLRFEKILTQIRYIDEEPPNYVDMFFHVRKFVEAQNTNMIYFLDESMVIWKIILVQAG